MMVKIGFMLNVYFLVFLLLLAGNSLTEAADFSLAPHVLISPSNKKDKHSLRRVLFGGEPHVSFCADPKNAGLDDFITKVRKNIGKSTDKIRTALIECDEVVYSADNSKKKKSLRKTLKLKKTQPGDPVILWSVNGDKPKQLPMNIYTSQIEEPKSKSEGKKAKKSRVSVQLDPKKLSEYVVKERIPKIKSIVSDEILQRHCFGRRYQLCGILFQNGKMSKNDQKFWLKVSNLHRGVRFFYVDTSAFQLSGLPLPELAIEKSKSTYKPIGLSLFRRRDYVYSGPKLNSDENVDVMQSLKATKAALEKRNENLKIPVEVPSLGPRIRISTGLQGVLDSLESEKLVDRLVAFRKEEIETSAEFNFEEQRDSLVVLLRDGTNGYFLDWERAASYLFNKAAFDELFNEKELVDLQFQSLSRNSKSQKGSDIEYLHFEGNSDSGTNVSAFLKMSVHPDMPMNSFKVVPSLKKLKKSITKTRTPSKSTNAPKKRKSSKPKNKPGTLKRETEQQRIERERKRRIEMDKEALETGAIALEADDVDIDEEVESCDEDEYLDEYSLDSDDDDDDGDEVDGEEDDEDVDTESEDEINLDDFEE